MINTRIWNYIFNAFLYSGIILFILTFFNNWVTSPYWGLSNSVSPSEFYIYYEISGFLFLTAGVIYYKIFFHRSTVTTEKVNRS